MSLGNSVRPEKLDIMGYFQRWHLSGQYVTFTSPLPWAPYLICVLKVLREDFALPKTVLFSVPCTLSHTSYAPLSTCKEKPCTFAAWLRGDEDSRHSSATNPTRLQWSGNWQPWRNILYWTAHRTLRYTSFTWPSPEWQGDDLPTKCWLAQFAWHPDQCRKSQEAGPEMWLLLTHESQKHPLLWSAYHQVPVASPLPWRILNNPANWTQLCESIMKSWWFHSSLLGFSVSLEFSAVLFSSIIELFVHLGLGHFNLLFSARASCGCTCFACNFAAPPFPGGYLHSPHGDPITS